jgi:hypothetical protein
MRILIISLIISLSCLNQKNNNLIINYKINNQNSECTELKIQINDKIRIYQYYKNDSIFMESINNLRELPVNFITPSVSDEIIKINFDSIKMVNFLEMITLKNTNETNVILGYNCEKYVFGTKDFPLGEVYFIKGKKVKHSFLSDIFKSSDKIPLKIKAYGGVEYTAIDINFNGDEITSNISNQTVNNKEIEGIEMLIQDTYKFFRP